MHHCDVDVAGRKQVAARMDNKSNQSGVVGNANDTCKALGSAAPKHPTNDHLHKESD